MTIVDDPTGWMKVWDDVWRLFGPPLALLIGGLVAVLLKRLNTKTEAVTKATADAAAAATVAAEKIAVVAEAGTQHLDAQDQKLEKIHSVVNGHKMFLEKQNTAYRQALAKGGLEIPEVTPDA